MEHLKTANQSVALKHKWIFLIQEDIFGAYSTNEKINIVKLRHPGTSKSARYIYSLQNNALFEIMFHEETNRSWLINDYVKSEGNLFLATPIDPLFLVLPRLSKECIHNAISLEQLLSTDDEFPDTKVLTKCLKPESLYLIADRRGTEEIKAFKYNQEKTLRWLQKKVLQLSAFLKSKSMHVADGAASTTFVCSTHTDIINEKSYIYYAYGIVSQYLDKNISKILAEYLEININDKDVQENSITRKRMSSPHGTVANKKQKIENRLNQNDFFSGPSLEVQDKNVKASSSKDKTRQKAALGAKKISSFFIKN